MMGEMRVYAKEAAEECDVTPGYSFYCSISIQMIVSAQSAIMNVSLLSLSVVNGCKFGTNF
jgi:hypothetical protein